jgi:ribosome biogenesis GTPase
MFMSLKELGWHTYFSRQFSDFRKKGYRPARILSAYKKSYILAMKKGEMEAEARGILWYERGEVPVIPVVGDWVAVSIRPGEKKASIHAVLKRINHFSRRVAGGRKRTGQGEATAQVIAANIDLAFVVVGLDRDYNLQRIERFLTLVQKNTVRPVIILNKTDRCSTYRRKKNEVQRLFPDIAVITMLALDEGQVRKLKKFFRPGITSALLGSSGVGKSTIINQLVGYNRQTISDAGETAGPGQHTTSRRELILLPEGGLIMDNPGMREIQLWADEQDLRLTFSDIDETSMHCRFRDCRHQHEPGCAVREAVENGKLDQRRVQNYIKLRDEVRQLQDRRIKRRKK